MDYTQIYADLKVMLSDVADKVGQGAEYGWTIVVKQQYVIGITDLIVAGLSLIGASLTVAVGVYFWKNLQKARCDDGNVAGIIFLGVIPSIILTVCFVTYLTMGIPRLINPDYYALEFFINSVKQPTAL